MSVVCMNCRNRIDKDGAYVDSSGKRNKYFCNKQCYDNYISKKTNKEKTRQQRILEFQKQKEAYKQSLDIMDLLERKSEDTYKNNIYEFLIALHGTTFKSFASVRKEWVSWNAIATNKEIFNYLQNSKDYLIFAMSKDFSSEYAWIRYLSAIIKNQFQKQTQIPKEESINKEVDFDFCSGGTTQRKKRKGFDSIGG